MASYTQPLSTSPPLIDRARRTHRTLLRPLERKHYFGVLLFVGVLCTSLLDINQLLKKLTGMMRVASPLMLVLCVLSLIAFRFRFNRSLGITGLFYIACMFIFLVPGSLIRLIDFSDYEVFQTAFFFKMYATSIPILLATALGTRCLMLAYPQDRAMRFLFGIAMIQVAAIFVDKLYGKQLFGAQLSSYRSYTEGERMMGFFANPNAAGFAVAATAALGFGCLIYKKHRALILACIAAAGLSCVLTFSRSSLIALFMLIIAQAVISPVLKQKSSLVVASVLFLLLAWVTLVGAQHIFDLNRDQQRRLASIPSLIKGDLDEKQTGHRFVVAQNGLEYWLKSPLFGHGIGKGNFLEGDIHGQYQLGPHNMFVVSLIDGGIPLFVAYCAFLLVWGKEAWSCRVPAIRTLVCGYFVVYCCHAMTSHTLYASNSHAALLGISFGMLAAGKEIARSRHLPNHPNQHHVSQYA